MKLEIGSNSSDKGLHFRRLSCTRRQKNLRQRCHAHDLHVTAALERVRQRRLASAIEGVDTRTMLKQQTCGDGIARACRRMQRRSSVVFAVVDICATLQEDLDTPFPVAGTRMEWSVSLNVLGREVCGPLPPASWPLSLT